MKAKQDKRMLETTHQATLLKYKSSNKRQTTILVQKNSAMHHITLKSQRVSQPTHATTSPKANHHTSVKESPSLPMEDLKIPWLVKALAAPFAFPKNVDESDMKHSYKIQFIHKTMPACIGKHSYLPPNK